MSANFVAVRARVAELLRAEVTDAEDVFDQEPGDLGAGTPLIVVSRRGRGRSRFTFRGGETRVLLWLDVYVVASDGTNGYLPDAVADVLDSVAQQIDTCIDAHQTDSTGGWEAIEVDADSTVEFGMFNGDGFPRFRERLGLIFRVYA